MSLQQELGQALGRVPVEAQELALELVRVLARSRLGWVVLFL